MSAAQAYWERRQFGRRESSIGGMAIMSGQASRRFTIKNISDGGALLVFEDDFIPQRSFRIEVDGTEFVLLCEVRHASAAGVGISFMRASEGVALNRYFQLKPADCATGDTIVTPSTNVPVLPRASDRSLRAAFLASNRVAPTPANDADRIACPVPAKRQRRAKPWVGVALALHLNRIDSRAGFSPRVAPSIAPSLALYSHSQ